LSTNSRDELLRRLAHPFWFQSFGAVMGMDWHSSGITTSVLGALKRGLKPITSPEQKENSNRSAVAVAVSFIEIGKAPHIPMVHLSMQNERVGCAIRVI
jgi:hypothetical protein